MILSNLHDDISRNAGNQVCVIEIFAPKVPRDQRWQQEAEDRHQNQEIFLLKLQNWVWFQIAHVDLGAIFFHIRVLFAHQPAHVREKETAAGVVRVSIRISKLVMHAVVANPLDDAVLEGNSLKNHKKDFEFFVGFVSAMRP